MDVTTDMDSLSSLTDIDTDMESTDMNTVPDLDTHGCEDPDDNAGDGSACLEVKFVEYDNPEDHGIPGATSEKDSRIGLVFSTKSKSKQPTVFGMPRKDLVCFFTLCTTCI
jgi:hypothetical protein